MKNLLYACALIAGILSLAAFRHLPDAWWFLGLSLISPVLLYFKQWLVLCLIVGHCWAALDASRYLEARLPHELARSEFLVTGHLVDFPKGDLSRVSFEFELDQPVAENWSGGRIRLSWRNPVKMPELGERWQFRVRLQPPSGMLNAGGFDYEAWLFVRNIVATGYVRGDAGLLSSHADWIDSMRQAVRTQIQQATKHDAHTGRQDAAGLLIALLVGDRSGLNEELRQEFQVTGTSHLIAISGLHIGIVAVVVWTLASFFWSRSVQLMRLIPAPLVGAACSIVGAFLYAALAGFAIPTQRALIMTSVFAGASLARLHYLPLDRFAFAAIAVVLYDPRSVWQPGFWFSFIAVLVLILLIQQKTGLNTETKSQWCSYIKAAVVAQFALSFMMLPIQAYLGMPLSLISPIVNLLAVPWFSFVLVPLALLAALVAALGFPQLLLPLLFLADGTLQVLGFFAAQVETVITARHALAASVLAGMAIVAFLFTQGWRWRLALVALYLATWIKVPELLEQQRLTLFDVGQGLALMVEVGHQRLIYDLGPIYGGGFNTAEAVILPYLRHRGIQSVEKLIISHDDADHRGGVIPFLEKMPVDDLIVGHPLSGREDMNDNRCIAGDRWSWGEVHFEFLHPQENAFHADSNDYSCVLLIQWPDFAVLLTGDITTRIERNLLHDTRLQQLNAVVVGHHGSNTSSSAPFVRHTSPDYALVSAGYVSRFGHPTAQVVKRWQDAGAEIHNTAETGMLSLERNAKTGQWTLTAYRERHGRFWNR